jgi:NAD-dependent deacetylase
MEESFQLARWILESVRTVVFTGAGVSTESGIPDFRSPGGLWERYDPEDFSFQRFLSNRSSRERYWEMSTEAFATISQATPNAAHRSIAKLERMGLIDCVITQNIDGLHQLAGTSPSRVIELHGTCRTVSCLSCRKRWPREEVHQMVLAGVKVPMCDACGGFLKPDTISFGQPMPEKETAEAFRRSQQADLFIVLGSSLVVQPAASLPVVAKEAGARLVIVNRDATVLDRLADLVIRGSCGHVMELVLEEVTRAGRA